MTTTLPNRAADTTTVAGPVRGAGRWIDHWDPEDATFWANGGRALARRNLRWSVLAEFLGFCVWALWSVVVPQLPGAGFTLTLDQQFWLIAVPSLVGAFLRVPYTFMVPLVGGRNWTVVSALLLMLPTLSLVWVVGQPETPFAVLLGIAALAGFGGGNFASSMTNISFFFPEAEKGKALGLNAAGGNLGTGIVQLVIPAVIAIGAGIHLERAGLIFVPLVLLAAVGAWRSMDNLSTAKSDHRSWAKAATHPHTWIISFLYIGTFGSFIGYSAAFPTLLKTQFPEVTTSIAFLGAVLGAASRPLGGTIADRFGGARVTIGAFAVMGLAAGSAILALTLHSFALFLGSFLVLFTGAGIGNGATYRMIPAVFRAGVRDGDELAIARRSAAGCIGIAGAVGAVGGFLVPRGFAMSATSFGSLVPAIGVFIGAYALMAALTWTVYLRSSARLADEGI